MHLLELSTLSEKQVLEIFELAKYLKENQNKKILSEKTFILFFPETSIRTRITFEKGIKDLGGECILFPPETLDKREEPKDVMNYLYNWADGLIIRHSDYSKLLDLSLHSSIPIVNAMTTHNHPCEILSDLYSIAENRENYRDLVYTFVGTANNISRSWMEIAKVMNLTYNHVCTSGNELTYNNSNYKFSTSLEATLSGSDVVLTDSLPSQFINKEYTDKYQITLERMKIANKGAIFFRNEEVSDEVMSSKYFVGYPFKKNLIYVQQAILAYCLEMKV
ncbi:ornithine carbamoyltransferase [Paenibacillus antarcticus]|uniref:Ornithine carbamoyltransferase n=1 Tax=Paenibacillus antarcticus TaxID=253703 RepID=A0A168PYE5_9BACL|nr:ornithine carbamoyltransferase [Paenibacillus antarcticus]OAB47188.1 ornithine carbamoyltransferase [Paenibacillus antarcticus]